jgi:hypothetical protein
MIALKGKKKPLRKQINGKFNNIGSAAENKKNITAEIPSCQKLHPAHSNLGYFLLWLQSL